MKTLLFERKNVFGNKSIEVCDTKGNLYQSYEYIENKKDAIARAKQYAELLQDFPEDERTLINEKND